MIEQEKKIDAWRPLVISLLACMSPDQMEHNFQTLLSPSFYQNRTDIYNEFGLYVWNNLEMGGIVTCEDLKNESDEDNVLDFIACFLFEVGLILKKGQLT
jgi:hypothetical protein